MKRLMKLLPILFLTIIIAACGPENPADPSPEQQQLEKLTKTWIASSVTFNGSENRTTDWDGFSLTITANKSYSTSSAFSPGPWPSSGAWTFEMNGDTPNINKIIRSDGLEVAISVSATNLTLTFNYDNSTHNGGRFEAINGEYVFSMTAN